MFYLIKNLITEILVSASDMHLLAKNLEILKRLRQKIQGRCYHEYGYIIKFVDDDCRIGDPIVQEEGCKVQIRFSAITFKPEKNEIIDFLVTQVSEQYVKGVLGHAIVVIPKSKIESNWRYKKEENAFIEENSKQTIQKDIKLRCKCFEMHVEMSNMIFILDYQMKIIGSLQGECLGPTQ